MSNGWMAADMPGSSPWDLVRIVVVLVLIVGLIILLLRFVGKRNRGWWMNRSLRSLGGLAVGTNKSIQIVEWNGRIYVLGIGENVTLLEGITDPELVAELLDKHESENATPDIAMPAFLKQWVSRRKAEEPPAADDPGAAKRIFEQTLEERMRELSQRRQKVEQLLDDGDSGNRTDKT
mgnify:CR=1 FL=1